MRIAPGSGSFCDAPLQDRHGLGKLPGSRQSPALAVKRSPHVGLAAQCLFIHGNRLGELPRLEIGLAQMMVELGLRRLVGLDGPLQIRDPRFQIRLVLHLGHSQVELLFAPCDLPRIVELHFTPIRPLVKGFLLQRGQKIPYRLEALDVVIGHHGVNDIVGPALRHVTGQAIRRRGVFPRCDLLIQRRRMTAPTDFRVVASGLLAPGDVMRIMAGDAGHRSTALLETEGLAEPVGGIDDDELVITPGARCMIEVEDVVRQFLTRPKGEHAPAVAVNERRQTRAGGLQVALHADFHLPFRTHPPRVLNAGSDRFQRGVRLFRYGDMVLPGPVAALTIDAFRDLPLEKRGPAEGVASGFDLRIRVVTEHATVMDSCAGIHGGNANRSRDSWPRKTLSRCCTSSPEARRACRRASGGDRSAPGCRNPPRNESPSPPRSLVLPPYPTWWRRWK